MENVSAQASPVLAEVPGFQEKLPSQEIWAFVAETFGRCEPLNFAVQLWDGQVWNPNPDSPPSFRLILRHPSVFRRLLVNPDFYVLGEAYVQGLYDVEGDLSAALEFAERLMDRAPGFVDRVRYAIQTIPALRINVVPDVAAFADTEVLGAFDRAKRAIGFHYDHPIEFWKGWLDPELVYSCAYFVSPEASLESAQRQQLEYICRKLDLRPGEELLDVGCGWGGLVLYAARHFGVRATGITLSEQQAEYANSRIREAGLQERCRVEVADLRKWYEREYDKIASIELIGHIPQVLQHQYFERIRELLRPGGLFLNQGICCSAVLASRGGADFVDRFVFPDSQLVPFSTMLRIAEGAGWEVRDIECLRQHYVLTLEAWRARLEQNSTRLRAVVPEESFRAIQLCLCGAAADFRAGGLSVYQTLFALSAEGELAVPLTREAWYAELDEIPTASPVTLKNFSGAPDLLEDTQEAQSAFQGGRRRWGITRVTDALRSALAGF